MKTRAAVAWEAGKPLEIETIDLDGPKAGEVLLRIVATGVCHTDAFTLSGEDPEGIFPAVLGHEGGAIVEEIGAGVTSLKVGDHVIPLYTPECGECSFCTSGKTTLIYLNSSLFILLLSVTRDCIGLQPRESIVVDSYTICFIIMDVAVPDCNRCAFPHAYTRPGPGKVKIFDLHALCSCDRDLGESAADYGGPILVTTQCDTVFNDADVLIAETYDEYGGIPTDLDLVDL